MAGFLIRLATLGWTQTRADSRQRIEYTFTAVGNGAIEGVANLMITGRLPWAGLDGGGFSSCTFSGAIAPAVPDPSDYALMGFGMIAVRSLARQGKSSAI